MNYISFIGVLVQFSTIIIFIKADDDIQTTVVLAGDNEKVSVAEGQQLQLLVKYDNVQPIKSDCWGSCQTSSSVIEVYCNVNYNLTQLRVIVKKEIKREDKGTWHCDYTFITMRYQMHRNFTIRKTIHVDVIFNDPMTFWYPIIGVIAVFILLIIIGQATCTIHFKRKAAAIQRQIEWLKRRGSSEDTVRYSKMPALKNKALPLCKEDRESGIYEALDVVPVPRVPEPPPLTTLPSSQSILPSSPPRQPASTSGSLPKGGGIFSSLSKKKTNKPDPDSVSKTSSLDRRVQERLPMPLPDEEVYEAVMETTPPASRKVIPPKRKEREAKAKKDDSQNEEFRGFRTQPKPPPPEPSFGSENRNAPVLPSQMMQGFKTQPTQPRLKPPPPGPKLGNHLGSSTDAGNAPVLPSQIKQGFRTQPRPKPPPPEPKFGSGANTMNTPILPSQLKQALELKMRGNAIPQEVPQRMAPFNPGFIPVPGSSGVAPPALRTMKPPPSPASTTSTLANKWKPPPPSKPKQLHPLPQPPKPEPIHVTTVTGADSTDDEEWTYEPLDKYQLDKTDHDRPDDDDDDDEWNYEPLDKYQPNIYNV